MKRYIYLSILSTLLLIGIGWLSTRSSFLKVANIEVHSSDGAVNEYARKKLMRHLGQSMWQLSTELVAENLLEVTEIASVVATRRWPSTLRVDLRLRRPLFRVDGDRAGFVRDADGILFAAAIDSRQLPVLYSQASSSMLKELGAFLDLYGDQLQTFRLSSFYWTPLQGLSLRASLDSPTIYLGFEHFEQAWLQAKYFLERADGVLDPKSLSSIDAAYKERVVVAFANQLKISENGLNLKEIVRRKANR